MVFNLYRNHFFHCIDSLYIKLCITLGEFYACSTYMSLSSYMTHLTFHLNVYLDFVVKALATFLGAQDKICHGQ